MKPYMLVAAFSLSCFIKPFQATSQVTQDWVSRYNGPATKFDGARAIAIDANNNLYVTGPSEGKKGNLDYVTIKYNSAGVQQWASRYNGTGNAEDWPYDVAVDANGNVYVTGRSIGSGTGADYATVKYNAAGVQLWVRRTTGPGFDIAKELVVDATGNVYVTGYTNGSNFVSGAAITTIKYTEAGDIVWTMVYDGLANNGTTANYEGGTSLALDGNGNVYVTGRSEGMITIKYHESEGNAVQDWVRKEGGVEGQKVLLDSQGNIIVTGWGSVTIKFNPLGDVLWKTTYPGNAAFADMVLGPLDDIYITGYSRENGTSDDYRTLKYNTAGVQQWSARFNGTKNGIDLARAIALDGSGNVYVTGRCELNDGSRNARVVYGTIKYDNNGVELWQAFYDGDSFGVVTDVDGNAYVTGQNSTRTTDFDIVTIKYLSAPVQTAKKISGTPMSYSTGLMNYPNPFKSSTTISYEVLQAGKVKLSILDLRGNELVTLVNEPKQAGRYNVRYAPAGLPAGAYLYKMETERSTSTSKFLLLK